MAEGHSPKGGDRRKRDIAISSLARSAEIHGISVRLKESDQSSDVQQPHVSQPGSVCRIHRDKPDISMNAGDDVFRGWPRLCGIRRDRDRSVRMCRSKP